MGLQTDDVGIFESPLSREYEIAMTHFGLSKLDAVRLVRGAMGCSFGDEAEKERVRGLLDRFAVSGYMN